MNDSIQFCKNYIKESEKNFERKFVYVVWLEGHFSNDELFQFFRNFNT